MTGEMATWGPQLSTAEASSLTSAVPLPNCESISPQGKAVLHSSSARAAFGGPLAGASHRSTVAPYLIT